MQTKIVRAVDAGLAGDANRLKVLVAALPEPTNKLLPKRPCMRAS